MIRFQNMACLILAVSICACGNESEEMVNLADVLHEGAAIEITNAYPEVAAKLVAHSESGILVGERYLEVEGIDNPEVATRIGRYIARYLNDPDLRSNEIQRQTEYEAMAPQAKMDVLLERIRERYPDFTYEWVGADEGNVEVIYGDNGLLMNGIDSDGAREEWAYGIMQIQQEIDAEQNGEQK